ncbi:esterase/lipase family protein [Acidovorax cavernicola]|nr:hypothetical protein [Acidovorax cavernicola]
MTLTESLNALRRTASVRPEIGVELDAARNRLALVFVPGILGSELTAPDGLNIFGRLENPGSLISRLELPEGLVDEQAESGVKASLLRSIGPMDFYGDAFSAIEQWGANNGIKVLACGYDWRRDIRSGARDLDRCISNLEAKYSDLVIVAHSMGGLVSWTWADRHARGEYGRGRRVLQLTVLGSPLRGSCEIVRMVQSGYIQPARDDQLQVRTTLKALTSWTEKLADAFQNGVAAQFTQGIRPLLLSWPGAIELSPPPSNNGDIVSCVGVPAGDDQPAGTPATSYYDVAFWSLPAGRQMLRKGGGPESYTLPASLPKVLAKAREFRSQFQPAPLEYPTWLYFSRIWKVPDQAGYRAPYISEFDQWGSTWGDGRVPYTSAMNQPVAEIFTRRMGVESVHGNLPGDPNFFDDYFGNHLPQALAAVWLSDTALIATTRPDWMAAIAKFMPNGPDSNQVRVALEPQGKAGKESQLLRSALTSISNFNALLCLKRGDCTTTYSAAKAKVAATPAASRSAVALKQYGGVARTLGQENPDFAFAEGNRGLALARQLDWKAASMSLARAETGVKELEAIKEQLSKPEVDFASTLRRNLGKSLIESGQCREAEPYLRAAANSWFYAKEALAKPCNDVESGLQYCFDRGDFCRTTRR